VSESNPCERLAARVTSRRAAVGQQLGSTAAEVIRRGMTVAPTLEIRPGYPFNVMVTQDLIFPGPYKDASQE